LSNPVVKNHPVCKFVTEVSVCVCVCARVCVRALSFQTVHQAQCLANQVQLFYGSQRQETFRLVESFNHAPTDFKHMSVIAELELSGLSATQLQREATREMETMGVNE